VNPRPVVQVETPGSLEPQFREALEELAKTRALQRLAERDPTLWKSDAAHEAVIRNRLGWLDAPQWLAGKIDELTAFAAEIRNAGFTRVLLLGMGGSSLAPEVFQIVSIAGPGAPTLDVLDSTDPATIDDIEAASRLDRTFFLVSSKSGKTIETLSQYAYMRHRLESSKIENPGRRFAAVTDEGSPLDRLAQEHGFRHVFRNPGDIGGRYSALSYFGMVPAALLGLDLRVLHARAAAARKESLEPESVRNGALRLGAYLGGGVRAGRNKLTIETAKALRPLGYWIEQLVAESTGKEHTGIVPIEGEPLGPAHHYGEDRLLLTIRLQGEPEPDLDRLEGEWTRTGAPWLRIDLPDRDAIAGEFYRWEVAVALVGALLHIDPFDEPNVQESKDATQRILDELAKAGRLPTGEPRSHSAGIEIHATDEVWKRIEADVPSLPSLEMILNRFLGLAAPHNYLAVLAFIERSASSEASFALLRRAIRNAIHVPVLQGYGPRYLHSIGQLYKGGPDEGMFLILTTEHKSDLAIPGKPFTFGQLETAQALGDYEALAAHGRPALRLHFSHGVEAGLATLTAAVERALSAMQGA